MSYHRTPEHRHLRAQLIRNWKPWLQSSGPRTKAGKAKSARNSWKHGNRSRVVLTELRTLGTLLRELRD